MAVAAWAAQYVLIKHAGDELGPTIGGGACVEFGGWLGWIWGSGGLVAGCVFGIEHRRSWHDEVA